MASLNEKQAEKHIEACLKKWLKKVKKYPVKSLINQDGEIVEINDNIPCISVNQLAELCKTRDFNLKEYEKKGIIPVSALAERKPVTQFGEEIPPKRLYPLIPALNAAKIYLMKVKRGTFFAPPVSTEFVTALFDFKLLIKKEDNEKTGNSK